MRPAARSRPAHAEVPGWTEYCSSAKAAGLAAGPAACWRTMDTGPRHRPAGDRRRAERGVDGGGPGQGGELTAWRSSPGPGMRRRGGLVSHATAPRLSRGRFLLAVAAFNRGGCGEPAAAAGDGGNALGRSVGPRRGSRCRAPRPAEPGRPGRRGEQRQRAEVRDRDEPTTSARTHTSARSGRAGWIRALPNRIVWSVFTTRCCRAPRYAAHPQPVHPAPLVTSRSAGTAHVFPWTRPFTVSHTARHPPRALRNSGKPPAGRVRRHQVGLAIFTVDSDPTLDSGHKGRVWSVMPSCRRRDDLRMPDRHPDMIHGDRLLVIGQRVDRDPADNPMSRPGTQSASAASGPTPPAPPVANTPATRRTAPSPAAAVRPRHHRALPPVPLQPQAGLGDLL